MSPSNKSRLMFDCVAAMRERGVTNNINILNISDWDWESTTLTE